MLIVRNKCFDKLRQADNRIFRSHVSLTKGFHWEGYKCGKSDSSR
jgi:hypothetical protein